jgi:hypothetical protein
MARRKETQDAIDQADILGEIGGLKWAEHHIMEKAKLAFELGKDERAKYLRTLATDIRDQHVKMRREYDAKLHPEFLGGKI